MGYGAGGLSEEGKFAEEQADGIDGQHDQNQISGSDPYGQEEIQEELQGLIGVEQGKGDQKAGNPCRSSHEQGSIPPPAIDRQPGYPPKQNRNPVKGEKPAGPELVMQDLPEPVKHQAIEENVKKVGVQKAVGQQGPNLAL